MIITQVYDATSEKTVDYSVDEMGYIRYDGKTPQEYFSIKDGYTCKEMIEHCQRAGIFKKEIDSKLIYNSVPIYTLFNCFEEALFRIGNKGLPK